MATKAVAALSEALNNLGFEPGPVSPKLGAEAFEYSEKYQN